MHARRALLLTLLALYACEEDEPPPAAARPSGDRASRCVGAGQTVDVAEQEPPEVACEGVADRIVCLGQWAARCRDEELDALLDCAEQDEVCVPRDCGEGTCDGCRACGPDDVRCGDDGALLRCNDEGTDFEQTATCDEGAGEVCNVATGRCEDLCAKAAEDGSYIGCEYWALATSNAQLDFTGQDAEGLCRPFSFAVAISNPQGVPAEVTVDVADGSTRSLRVAPDAVRTLELPCDPALKGSSRREDRSLKTAGVAAHRIRANVPVTVYQFNPLEYQAELDGRRVYSHTNDASLLFPVHSMTGNYRVIALATLRHEREILIEVPPDEADAAAAFEQPLVSPGFVALVGVEETPTEVEIVSSAHTLPSADGELPALVPGQSFTTTLERGQVLQLASAAPDDCAGDSSDVIGGEVRWSYCKVPRAYDLTGTQIRAGGKVSVIAGHDCAFLPFDRWACDHVEETLLPVETWGREVTVSVSETVACQPTVPNLLRVLSATDGNRVTFTPALTEPVTLDAGDSFDLEYSEDVRVVGSDAILVAQYLLGQDYEGRGSAGSRAKGDPSMSLAIPLEQWRADYAFLTPETYSDNYVNLIAREGQTVLLDGKLVQGFHAIEGTDTRVARVPVRAGIHRARSLGSFGLVLYGYAAYTSYMLPGGLDLNAINRPR